MEWHSRDKWSGGVVEWHIRDRVEWWSGIVYIEWSGGVA